jgi:hypothetical protein
MAPNECKSAMQSTSLDNKRDYFLLDTKGDVLVKKEATTNREKGAKGSYLPVKTEVMTGKDAKASLISPQCCRLDLDQNTIYKLDRIDACAGGLPPQALGGTTGLVTAGTGAVAGATSGGVLGSIASTLGITTTAAGIGSGLVAAGVVGGVLAGTIGQDTQKPPKPASSPAQP